MKFWLPIVLFVMSTSARAADLCDSKTQVVIDSKTTALYLCEEGKVVGSHLVNLGKGGMGKRKQGDLKTPLGVYGLSKPRASNSGFAYFVPINYPTNSREYFRQYDWLSH